MTKRGKFIAVEGIDGVGKSTSVHNLAKELNAEVLTPLSPKDSETFKFMLSRGFSQEDIHLFSLAAIKDTSDYVEELVSQGKNVIIDRYIYSSIAYYSACAEKSSETIFPQDIDALKLVKPDITFYLTIDDDEIWKDRLNGREDLTDQDHDIQEDIDFKKTILRTFTRFLQEGEMESINVSNLTPKEVSDRMKSSVLSMNISNPPNQIKNFNGFYPER